MVKSNKKTKTSSALPLTPLLYINDPQLETPNIHAISAVIPSTKVLSRYDVNQLSSYYRTDPAKETVVIIADHMSNVPYDDHDDKLKTSNNCKALTIKQGRNFASVNLYLHSGTHANKLKEWGTNHLDLNVALLSPEEVADKVYKWLFTVLTVPETLHLISEAEMHATNTASFPNYAYCPLSASSTAPPDAKIQFVALITSKPVITPGKVNPKTGVVEGSRLHWTVADRTGTATFYFLHRGASSDATWEWVLSLKVGDRRALPRMPSVPVTENNITHVVKAPFRLVGSCVSGTGKGIAAIGRGIAHVGEKAKLGKSKEWVPEADVRYDGKGKAYHKDDKKMRGTTTTTTTATTTTAQAEAEYKREVKVFDEKGRRLWGDEDSLASTEGGSVVDEKEFA